MISKDKAAEIREKARQIRLDIVEMLGGCGSGHPGGSLSVTDILAVLYFHKMKYDPKDPSFTERDRFVLSKGHAAPALYSALSLAGFFPREYLKTLRQIGSSLQGHPDRNSLAGVEMTTGSLGQGLSIANGMALAGRIGQKKIPRILRDRRRRVSGRTDLGSRNVRRPLQAGQPYIDT